jgi:PAS domain S-box-containing protein
MSHHTRFEALLSATPNGIQECDLDGVILYSNPAHHALLGFEPGELLGKTVFDLYASEEEKQKLRDYRAHLISDRPTPTPLFTFNRRKDGSRIAVRIDWNYLHDEAGKLTGFISVISDNSTSITLREQLQQELDLTRHYLDVAQFMLVVLDKAGNVTLINRKSCEVLGYTRGELLGRNWLELCIPKPDREEITATFLQLISGNLEIAEYYENEILTASGERRMIAWHNTLQHDRDGHISGTISSGEDITEKTRIREEKAKLQDQIRRAQQMEALARLTSGIAHDFNNILASILGYADLTLEAVSQLGEKELVRYLDEVITEGEKARDLITQMLAFTRPQSDEDIALNPLPLVKELGKVYQASLPDNIKLMVSTDAVVPKIHIHPGLLHQALLGLCRYASNALENQQGHISISASRVNCSETRCSACGKIVEGEYVEISVADDGKGLPPEALEHLFEAPPTHHDNDDSDNLELITANGIVHEHYGHIIVDSIPDYGTCVRLLLPTVLKEGVSRSAETRPGYGARILIVESDESIADLQGAFLQSRGFQTETCTDTYGALAMISEESAKFDCLVVDETMPSFSGIELAKKIFKLRPDLPVILYTTKIKPDDSPELAKTGIKGQLYKPFSSEQLFDLVTRLLQAG